MILRLSSAPQAEAPKNKRKAKAVRGKIPLFNLNIDDLSACYSIVIYEKPPTRGCQMPSSDS